ncbi:MAG: PAS domain-containing protein, partial [Limnobacter sp.]|nr:PAS domain-containing protein [Limnobacter sp.]
MARQHSIASRTLRAIGLVMVLAIAPLFFIGHLMLDQANRRSALLDLEARAGMVAQLLELDLRSKMQSLDQGAEFLKTVSLARLDRQKVEYISGKFDGVVWSGFADLDGKVVYATQGLLEGADVSKRPWFQSGKSGPSVLDVHDALLLASKLPARDDQYKFIDIAVPVYNQSRQLAGVLAIHFDWSWYQKKFETMLGQHSPVIPFSTVVTDSKGELRVARLGGQENQQELDDMLAQIQAPISADAKYLIYTYVPPKQSLLDTLNWRINMVLPEAAVLGQSNRSVLIAMGALAVGMMIMALILLALAKKVAQGIDSHLGLIEKEAFDEVSFSEKSLPKEILPIMVKIRELFGGVQARARQVEKELSRAKDSYAEFNEMIRQAPVAMAMFDPDMRYLACSKLWRERYFPLTRSPEGKLHEDLVPDMPAKMSKFYALALKGESVNQQDDHWTLDEGRSVWVDWSLQPWYTKSGAVGGVVFATLDVTQEHLALEALAQSQERFQLAMEGSSDGLWDWNITTNEVYFSPAWKRMLGYTEDELEGDVRTWERLLHPEDQAEAVGYLRKVIENPDAQVLNFSFRLAHKNGSWVKVLSRGVIMRNEQGKAIRMVGTHFDRTEIESLQDELHEAWIVAQAESRSNEMKSKFLATVSHEIRNPLNAV